MLVEAKRNIHKHKITRTQIIHSPRSLSLSLSLSLPPKKPLLHPFLSHYSSSSSIPPPSPGQHLPTIHIQPPLLIRPLERQQLGYTPRVERGAFGDEDVGDRGDGGGEDGEEGGGGGEEEGC